MCVCVIDMSWLLARLQEVEGVWPDTWKMTETDGPGDDCVLNNAGRLSSATALRRHEDASDPALGFKGGWQRTKTSSHYDA